MTAAPAGVRHFTREEANRTLPLVKLIVRDIVELHTDLETRRERLEGLRAHQRARQPAKDDLYAEEVLQMQNEVEADGERLQSFIEELAKLGVALRDPAHGAVTFEGQGAVNYQWCPDDAEVRQDALDNTFNLYSAPPKELAGDELE